MSTLNIKLYDVLSKELNLSEEKGRHITEAIEEAVMDKVQNDLNQYNSAFRVDFKELDTKIDKEVGKLELRVEQSKNETIRWFISLFIALALMIIGIYIKK